MLDEQALNAQDERARTRPAEVRMADLILQLSDEVARATMQTFLHFAQDPARISVRVEACREHGLQFVLVYPPARS